MKAPSALQLHRDYLPVSFSEGAKCPLCTASASCLGLTPYVFEGILELRQLMAQKDAVSLLVSGCVHSYRAAQNKDTLSSFFVLSLQAEDLKCGVAAGMLGSAPCAALICTALCNHTCLSVEESTNMYMYTLLSKKCS